MKKQTPEEVLKLEPVAVRYKTAAGLLDCSESTARKLVREGKLKTMTIGADERITLSSIRKLAGK